MLVKLASATWRIGTHYLGAAAYQHRGPQPALARVLGPILSLTIVLVLISGIAPLLGPSSLHRTALRGHKDTFYLALLLIVWHLAMHLTQALRLGARDCVSRRGAALLVRPRWTAIVGSVLLGALLAVTLCRPRRAIPAPLPPTVAPLPTPLETDIRNALPIAPRPRLAADNPPESMLSRVRMTSDLAAS